MLLVASNRARLRRVPPPRRTARGRRPGVGTGDRTGRVTGIEAGFTEKAEEEEEEEPRT